MDDLLKQIESLPPGTDVFAFLSSFITELASSSMCAIHLRR